MQCRGKPEKIPQRARDSGTSISIHRLKALKIYHIGTTYLLVYQHSKSLFRTKIGDVALRQKHRERS
jgi:hypothetical protein